MKIIDVKALPISDIKVIRFGRFCDHRGYFTEFYKKSDFNSHPDTVFLRDVEFVQANESYSRAGTVRGLHFQWNPYMGKMIRTLRGRMVDLALDIRKGSPTFGKIVAYDMPAGPDSDFNDWIWVPPGFAHGNFFPRDTLIEYLCSGGYSPDCEGAVSPLAGDLDWSLCDTHLRAEFQGIIHQGLLISDKDRAAPSLREWERDSRSDHFLFGKM